MDDLKTGSYDVSADPKENRLYLELTGRLGEDRLQAAAREAVAEAERLREGFDIVNDLSGFSPPNPESAEAIKEAQAELMELGVDRVVRIVDEDTSTVVENAFKRRSRKVGYEGMSADSIEEAEQMLS
ncbi:hypothetical protein NGM10_00665 [Halorussus salilacus]|uniref:hypothetical protein n=1 Tax=Halorussus salilacus TaxID=2953750 RepID=UPI00209FABA7|nr:hypothetical protein [Halorussus salilacus]USZ68269.1 hypothetical protein NGM10_00665 [Halorussus salilacus]